MRHMKVSRIVVALAVLAAAASPAAAGSPATEVQFVHGIGTVPGDNPVDVYLAEDGATTWELVSDGPIAYTEQAELGFVVGVWSLLLCTAVADPAETVETCPEGAVNAGGAAVSVPDADHAVLVAGYGPPEGDPAVTFDVFEVDTTCVEAGQARYQVAHASAMAEVTLFVDNERGDREPIAHGESVTAGVSVGEHGLRLVTVGDEYFVLDEPAVAAPGGETTFLALVGPGDPTPVDPATTDLRFVPIAYGVEPCPVATVPSTTTTSVVPDPGPPAAPQPEPPDFTG